MCGCIYGFCVLYVHVCVLKCIYERDMCFYVVHVKYMCLKHEYDRYMCVLALGSIHMVLWIQGKIRLIKMFADHLCVGMSTQSLKSPHLECPLFRTVTSPQ